MFCLRIFWWASKTVKAKPFPHNSRCGCSFAQFSCIGTKSKIKPSAFLCDPLGRLIDSCKDAYKHRQNDEMLLKKEWIIRAVFPILAKWSTEKKHERWHAANHMKFEKYNIFITHFSTISILFFIFLCRIVVVCLENMKQRHCECKWT